MSSYANYPHSYYNNPPSSAWKISVADSAGLVLAVTCVSIRCFMKFCITKSPGWEDRKLRCYADIEDGSLLNKMSSFQSLQSRHWRFSPPTLPLISSKYFIMAAVDTLGIFHRRCTTAS